MWLAVGWYDVLVCVRHGVRPLTLMFIACVVCLNILYLPIGCTRALYSVTLLSLLMACSLALAPPALTCLAVPKHPTVLTLLGVAVLHASRLLPQPWKHLLRFVLGSLLYHRDWHSLVAAVQRGFRDAVTELSVILVGSLRS